ncbi:MAG: non-hydrolyzing UDP-N-acetylglucosamine 2-epimerase [Bryobacteraceae bacterium]
MHTILFVLGTRPEAIKLAPLIRAVQEQPSRFRARVCVTAQHREMLDQVLTAFGLETHHDLNVMQSGQTLSQSSARIIASLEPVFQSECPDVTVVQGDTTTTFCGALASFYARVPVAHVEAGLRTGDIAQPFPEEMNRVLTSRLASLHFAATEGAAANLRAEGVNASDISVTGNTGVDAILHIRDGLESGRVRADPIVAADPSKRLIMVTAHRRESFGPGFERICAALGHLAARGDVEIVYPVHPNPNVREPVHRLLGNIPGIRLVDPLGYVPFVDLMRRSALLITDSGGVQEEGPSLGKPVLVLREKTERPEAVEAGTVRLVGTDPARIVAEAETLLDNPEMYHRMSRVHNPYGDGRASGRILALIHSFLSGKSSVTRAV